MSKFAKGEAPAETPQEVLCAVATNGSMQSPPIESNKAAWWRMSAKKVVRCQLSTETPNSVKKISSPFINIRTQDNSTTAK